MENATYPKVRGDSMANFDYYECPECGGEFGVRKSVELNAPPTCWGPAKSETQLSSHRTVKMTKVERSAKKR